MWNQKPCFRFEIDNFSEQNDSIASPTFVSGGCEWFLYLPQKADTRYEDHLSLFLTIKINSLQSGGKRSAYFYFSVKNQSDKELYRSPIGQSCYPFCAQSPSWGRKTTVPLSKLQEKGFLENDRLIIEVYINIVEAVDGDGGFVSKKKESLDNIGSQDYASKVTLVRKIFAENPEIAEEFKPKNQVAVKTEEYMNILRNSFSKFSEQAEIELKLDWLKAKLGEFSLKSKKVSLENKKEDDVDGSWVQYLEKLIKKPELKSKLEEVSLEKKNLYDVDVSRVQQLEERVKNLELMENDLRLDSLESKLEEVSMEKKKADLDVSQVQQLKARVRILELIVSNLKTDLDKEKAESESSADEYLFVDTVAC